MRRFGADLGSILERFWVPKWTPNRAETCFKSDHGKNAKMSKNHCFFLMFLGFPWGSKIGQKWARNRFENGLKLRCQNNTEKWAKMVPKWTQVGAMLGSKIVLGASKSRKKRHRKRDKNRARNPYPPRTTALPRRGATPSQNGLPRGAGGLLS